MFLARLGDELHLSVVISLEGMNRHAVIAKPKELSAFVGGGRRKLEQLALTEVAEFSRAVRIVTLGHHRRSSDTNCAAHEMDARKMVGRCPGIWMHLYSAARESSGTDSGKPGRLAILRFLCAERLLRLLSALARALRRGDVVCVLVVFVHSEIENKAT